MKLHKINLPSHVLIGRHLDIERLLQYRLADEHNILLMVNLQFRRCENSNLSSLIREKNLGKLDTTTFTSVNFGRMKKK